MFNSMIDSLENRVLLASPHFVDGPTFTTDGNSLVASGSVAGLGNEDVTITLNAQGTATTVCTNPAGKVAPGQTRDVNLSGEVTLEDPKNGRVNFTVATEGDVEPYGCPNPKWTGTVTVEFNSATLIVEQGGETVLSVVETFD